MNALDKTILNLENIITAKIDDSETSLRIFKRCEAELLELKETLAGLKELRGK